MVYKMKISHYAWGSVSRFADLGAVCKIVLVVLVLALTYTAYWKMSTFYVPVFRICYYGGPKF